MYAPKERLDCALVQAGMTHKSHLLGLLFDLRFVLDFHQASRTGHAPQTYCFSPAKADIRGFLVPGGCDAVAKCDSHML